MLSVQKHFILKDTISKENLKWGFIQNSSGVRVRIILEPLFLHLICLQAADTFLQIRIIHLEKMTNFLPKIVVIVLEAAGCFYSHLVSGLLYFANPELMALTASVPALLKCVGCTEPCVSEVGATFSCRFSTGKDGGVNALRN